MATKFLLDEVDSGLSSNHWLIIDNGSEQTRYRLYLAAALRHTCDVLASIVIAAQAGDELAVRILGRAHVEAWLTAVYLRFGEYEALERIAADTLNDTQLANDAIKRFDSELAEAKKKAENKLKKVRATNEGISLWNAQHPDEPPKPLIPEPHIPTQPMAGIDLSPRIADFANLARLQAQSLPLSVIADRLTKLGPEKGFAYENFTQVYLYYRLMSGASAHPTLHLYDAYFEPPSGHFVHTSPRPVDNSAILTTWSMALDTTAMLVVWVLRDEHYPTQLPTGCGHSSNPSLPLQAG